MVVPERKDSDYVQFGDSAQVSLWGPIPKGSTVIVRVSVVDIDTVFDADDHIASFEFRFQVPYTVTGSQTLSRRDTRPTWYSDMSVEFQANF